MEPGKGRRRPGVRHARNGRRFFRRPGCVARVLVLGSLGFLAGLAPVAPVLAQAGGQAGAQTGAQAAPGTQTAVERDLGQKVFPILLIDRERLFRDSAYGQRLAQVIEEERQRQQAETRRIEDELKAEELALTQERDSLSPEAFRARADAFDAKVQKLRQDRDTAEQQLLDQIDRTKTLFLQQARPVLAQILREMGAQLILDRRVALLAVNEIDITDMAIARIDAQFAAGAGNTDANTDANPGGNTGGAGNGGAGDPGTGAGTDTTGTPGTGGN